MSRRHLVLVLEAPLMSFGGAAVDNFGVIDDFPALSMLTGLLGNALGYRHGDRDRLDRLQDRLVFAARRDREGASPRLRDFQTAHLGSNDFGWTTRGKPEGRDGGAGTYKGPHLRYRDYGVDLRVTVALRLDPAEEAPDLDDLAGALDRPARPLFIGRKPCLPADRLFHGWAEGDTALGALATVPGDGGGAGLRVQWPEREGHPQVPVHRRFRRTDRRNWVSGLHGGDRPVCEGVIVPPQGAAP